MSALVGQIGVIDELLINLVRVVVLASVAVVTGVIAGIVHRWYAGSLVPDGLSVLVGLSVVAVYLNTAGALGEVIGGQVELLALETAVFNTVTFFVAGVAAAGGGRIGDRMGVGVFAISGTKSVDTDVSRIVRTVGRVTTVRVPDEIEDIVGYDPVEETTKEKLAGQTLVFPRRLTVGELRSRFVDRLQTDYGVGHIDVEFTDGGKIEYLAIGGRESGIGPTLPPGSAAVAIRADPPNNASPGDVVQLWTDGDPASETKPQRVTNAEIRGTAEEVVTLSMDEPDAKQLDTSRRYRLVTLPVQPRVDREFASQLRTAAETMGAVTIGAECELIGSSIGALDVAVVAIKTTDGEIVALPTRSHLIEAGETVYAIGRPAQLRKLETASVDGSAPVSDSIEESIDDE